MSIKFSVFPVDNSPGFIVHLLDTQMKAGLKRAFQSKGYNITPEQWGVLSRLWVKDGIHQNTVAKRTSKDRHTITRILNLLKVRKINVILQEENVLFTLNENNCVSVSNQR